jgi:hypothetical protein
VAICPVTSHWNRRQPRQVCFTILPPAGPVRPGRIQRSFSLCVDTVRGWFSAPPQTVKLAFTDTVKNEDTMGINQNPYSPWAQDRVQRSGEGSTSSSGPLPDHTRPPLVAVNTLPALHSQQPSTWPSSTRYEPQTCSSPISNPEHSSIPPQPSSSTQSSSLAPKFLPPAPPLPVQQWTGPPQIPQPYSIRWFTASHFQHEVPTAVLHPSSVLTEYTTTMQRPATSQMGSSSLPATAQQGPNEWEGGEIVFTGYTPPRAPDPPLQQMETIKPRPPLVGRPWSHYSWAEPPSMTGIPAPSTAPIPRPPTSSQEHPAKRKRGTANDSRITLAPKPGASGEKGENSATREDKGKGKAKALQATPIPHPEGDRLSKGNGRLPLRAPESGETPQQYCEFL